MTPNDKWREKWKRKIAASQLIQTYRIANENVARVSTATKPEFGEQIAILAATAPSKKDSFMCRTAT